MAKLKCKCRCKNKPDGSGTNTRRPSAVLRIKAELDRAAPEQVCLAILTGYVVKVLNVVDRLVPCLYSFIVYSAARSYQVADSSRASQDA